MARLLRGLLLSTVLVACNDASAVGISEGGVSFRYDDGILQPYKAASDSALYRVGTDSSFMATGYVPAEGAVPKRKYSWLIDSLGGTTVPVGSYTINIRSPLLSSFEVRSAFEIAVADSGTVTVTRSDPASIAGSLDLHFTYQQFQTTQPAPFHLTGHFVFIRFLGGQLPQ